MSPFPHGPEAVRDTILAHLERAGVPFVHLQHPAPASAEEASRARGVPIEHLAKALLMRVDGRRALFVVGLRDVVDNRALRAHLSARKARFVSAEVLLAETGLVRFTVPPFGRPIIDADLYVDAGVLELPAIAFGLGDKTHSVRMRPTDWALATSAEAFVFT